MNLPNYAQNFEPMKEMSLEKVKDCTAIIKSELMVLGAVNLRKMICPIFTICDFNL